MGEAEEAVKELNKNVKTLKEQLTNRVDEHGETIQGYDERLEAHDEKMQELEDDIREGMKKVDKLNLEQQKPSTPEGEPSKDTQKLFGKQLRAVAGKDELTEEDREKIKDSFETRALVEDTDAPNLVPKEIQDEIIRTVTDQTILRSLVSSMTINSNRTEFKNLNADVSMSYGASLESGGSLTEGTPTHGSTTYYVEDMQALAKIGKNLIQDNILNLAQEVQDAYVNAKAQLEDTKFMTGSGHSSNEPEGIIQAGSDYEVDLGESKPTFDDLLNLMYGKGSTAGRLKSPFRQNGVFLMHSFTALYLMKKQMVSAASYDSDDSEDHTWDGAYMWQPSLQAGAPNTFRGKPVYAHDDLTGEGSYGGGDYVAVFGDLNRAYRIIERQGLEVQTLTEKYAEAGQVGYLFHARNSGKVHRPEALRLLTY